MVTPHAGKVEPLDGARVVIAAVGGLVGVDGELHGRGVALLLGLALLLLGRLGPFLPRLQGQLIRRVVHHRSIPRGVVGVPALTVALASRPAGRGTLSRGGHRCLLDRTGAPLGDDPLTGLAGLLEAEGVHLAGAVLYQLGHLGNHMDLLVAELLATDEGPLQLNLKPLTLCRILLALVTLIDIVNLLQDLCKAHRMRKELLGWASPAFVLVTE
uniref:Uncharacterized protein n=1 Tax=Oncorhynchus tshawytscha TaxID=74940 RepID=A0A8C8EH60_ONCTS